MDACILSDSMNMIQKVKTGDVRREWAELLEKAKIRASLRKLTYFCPRTRGRGGKLTGRLIS